MDLQNIQDHKHKMGCDSELYNKHSGHILQDKDLCIFVVYMQDYQDILNWWCILVCIQYKDFLVSQANICMKLLGFFLCTQHWFHRGLGCKDLLSLVVGWLLKKDIFIRNPNHTSRNNSHFINFIIKTKYLLNIVILSFKCYNNYVPIQ